MASNIRICPAPAITLRSALVLFGAGLAASAASALTFPTGIVTADVIRAGEDCVTRTCPRQAT